MKVTISTITPQGVLPQFYQRFEHEVLADEYGAMWRALAAKAGVLIRVDKEMMG